MTFTGPRPMDWRHVLQTEQEVAVHLVIRKGFLLHRRAALFPKCEHAAGVPYCMPCELIPFAPTKATVPNA